MLTMTVNYYSQPEELIITMKALIVLNPRRSYPQISHCFIHAGTYNPRLHNTVKLASNTTS